MLVKDGSPQVTPVWVDIDNDNNYIIVNTTEGRVNQKSVARDPRVVVSVADSANSYNMVTVQEHIVEQTAKGADERIDKMAKSTFVLTSTRSTGRTKSGYS
jgi:Pyridoxamine 5'-phosphate oxidase